ncbi:substrate-binding domain-containing protein [Maribellus comscasis]|uniref:Substrate-binding domain-containing protein n=1 Tax=Maribellus comscasis TaxID=2681766 RepID=A0A6I6JV94_9BACT|nr:substrate-binding domain-containing protein [Maribellus comscasis]QGY47016.1 substrate-binding domain-containing protein [Maribellus comscasis]
MKKTSLNDIAQQLGVSKTLVSLVLNGKGKEHRISEDIQKKVKKLAKELNYRPNQIAKGLRTGKTNTIGLIIADMANPFFGKLGREIEKEASLHGYRVMFCSSDEKAENSQKQIEMLQQGQVDGIIISPPEGSEEQILSLEASKTPYVLVDRYFADIDSNYVVVDNFQAAYEGTMHLINNEIRKIACVTTSARLVNMIQRLEGYKKALTDSNIPVLEERIKVMPFSHEKNDVFYAIKELLSAKDRVEAILFTTSKIGVMGLESIHSLGMQVPSDVRVVSFDDPDAYKISFPPISAIAQPLKEIGRESVKILLENIKNKEHKKQKVMLNTRFIARKSSSK